MDATLDYSATRPAGKPLSERFNFRLVGFLLVVTLPFVWVLWMIFGQQTIVNRGDYYEVDLKAMGNFPLNPTRDTDAVIPAEVRALNGKKVRFEGEMYAPDQADKIKQFVLVPDLFACCFGQPPQVQHSIIVSCPEGKAVSYFPDQIQVEGKLKVEEKKDDGFIVSIFEVNCTSVKPAPK